MIKTFGSMPTTLPDGMFVAVRFPTLALLDTKTGDGRMLLSEGADSREVPLSISAQFAKSYGHDGAVLTGAVYEVTIDPEAKKMSGRGFLLDDEHGRRHALAIKTGAMKGNSVGLAEVKARFVEDLNTGEYWIEFTEFKLADTSGVMTPAFAEAYAEIDDTITASFAGFDPMEELVASEEIIEYRLPAPKEPTSEELNELMASFGAPQPYASFFRPEASGPQKIVFTAEGDVYGHLATWEGCHEGIEGRCIRVPRPTDNYASWNKPGVLTERGIVATGPICLYGGHKYGDDLDKAYGKVENSWCDVRITEGRFGPWVSGRARPHIGDEKAYDARASRISGHWKGGALRAIVSVNSEGYDVPGSDVVASFVMGPDGEITDLVAGFAGCINSVEPAAEISPKLEVFDMDVIVEGVLAQLRKTGAIGDDDAALAPDLRSAAALLAELIGDDLADEG